MGWRCRARKTMALGGGGAVSINEHCCQTLLFCVGKYELFFFVFTLLVFILDFS